MPRHTLLALAPAALAACASCDALVNVPPLRRYTAALVATSGVELTLDTCAMFGGSRRGYCLVAAPPGMAERFTVGLQLVEGTAAPVYRDDTCLALAPFGEVAGQARAVRAGVRVFRPGGPLPPNQDNVRLEAVYVGEHVACVELVYPYG